MVPGTTYYDKVRAYKTIAGTKVYRDDTSVMSKKAVVLKPTGVKTASKGITSIQISWSKVKGAGGYEIYRATSKNGTYKKVATVKGGNASYSYTNKSLTKGKTYYYKVRAVQQPGSKTYKSAFTSVKTASLK